MAEENLDLEQYARPEKKKTTWLKKGAKVAMPLLFTAGALMTGQGTARAEGPNELQTPTPVTTKGPEVTPTPTRQQLIEREAARLKAEGVAIDAAIARDAEVRRQAEIEEAKRQEQVGQQNIIPQESPPQLMDNKPVVLKPKDGESVISKGGPNITGLFVNGLGILAGAFFVYELIKHAPGWLLRKLKEKLPGGKKRKEQDDIKKAQEGRLQELAAQEAELKVALLKERLESQRARRSGGSGTPPPATPTP